LSRMTDRSQWGGAMNCDRVLQLLEEEPENWAFGVHTAVYKPTGQQVWTGNGLLGLDFYPSQNGAFNMMEKWFIYKAVARAEACRFGIARVSNG